MRDMLKGICVPGAKNSRPLRSTAGDKVSAGDTYDESNPSHNTFHHATILRLFNYRRH